MAVRAVFFDVGETLVDEERYWREMADAAGIGPHVVWAALGKTIERGEEHRELWRHLGIERPRVWDGLVYSLDDLYPDALDCLERLRADGMLVGLAGNQDERLERWARSAGLPVDLVTGSASLGVRKPEPGFFEALVELAQRGEALHVLDERQAPQPMRPHEAERARHHRGATVGAHHEGRGHVERAPVGQDRGEDGRLGLLVVGRDTTGDVDGLDARLESVVRAAAPLEGCVRHSGSPQLCPQACVVRGDCTITLWTGNVRHLAGTRAARGFTTWPQGGACARPSSSVGVVLPKRARRMPQSNL